MKALLIIVCTLLFVLGFSQDSINVARKYGDKRPLSKLDSALFFNIPNCIYISLNEGFDDTITVTINKEIIFKGYTQTNHSIGFAGEYVVSFNDSSEVKILEIKFSKTRRYIRERINFEYKSLEVRKLQEWTLIYSSHFYFRE